MPSHLTVLAVISAPPNVKFIDLSLRNQRLQPQRKTVQYQQQHLDFNSQRQLNRKRDHNRIHNIIMDLPIY